MRTNKCFTRGIIKEFGNLENNEPVIFAIQNSAYLLNTSMQNILNKKSFISNNYKIIPVNECLYNAVCSKSSIDLLLTISSPEIELNTLNRKTNNNLKRFFTIFKENFKFFKSKKKKKHLKPIEVKDEMYTLPTFVRDLMYELTQITDTNTRIYANENSIKICNKEIFPFDINVLITLIDDNGNIKKYNISELNFSILNYDKRFVNLNRMQEKTNSKFYSLLKIYNSLYFQVFKSTPNCIYTESLVYNCPVNIFESDDICENFIISYNYLKNLSVSEYKSIIDDKNLFKDKLNNVSILMHMSFLNKIYKNLNIE